MSILNKGKKEKLIFEKKFNEKGIHYIYFINDNLLTNMSYMFFNCLSLIEINLSSFKTQNVTNMSEMFCNCSSLKEINLSSFKTDNVINMSDMFSRCSSLKEINLSSFKANNVIFMKNMFSNINSNCKIICTDNKIIN